MGQGLSQGNSPRPHASLPVGSSHDRAIGLQHGVEVVTPQASLFLAHTPQTFNPLQIAGGDQVVPARHHPLHNHLRRIRQRKGSLPPQRLREQHDRGQQKTQPPHRWPTGWRSSLHAAPTMRA